MAAKNHDLHGSAPDKSAAALVLIDVINALDFRGGRRMLKAALPAARRIAALKRRAREARVPVIYANDNFGRWRSDFAEAVKRVAQANVPGRFIAELLAPEREDYFVLKPKHSAFFSTTLSTLLEYLKVKTLVLTGYAGDVCVLATAMDAYMRDLHLYVPRDCTASASPTDNRQALAYMARVLDARTTVSTRIDLRKLRSAVPR
jgi:nicotinamidase-related amidase